MKDFGLLFRYLSQVSNHYPAGEEVLRASQLPVAKPQQESVHSIQLLGPGGG